VFEFSEVFNEDYLYFYGPQLEAVSDAEAETIWRLLDLEPGMERTRWSIARAGSDGIARVGS
jgi:hypothetical protein